MNELMKLLNNGAASWDIKLSQKQIDQFDLYLENLKEWNNKLNITAIKDDKEIIIKHFLDALSATIYINSQAHKYIDIGTGGGLPGLPIKIVWPQIDITFVDSSKKKIEVVERFCDILKIKENISFLQTPIEKMGREHNFRETFDVVLARAVAPLNILLEYGIPLLSEKGRMIIYKGPNVDEEVENSEKALGILNAQIEEKHCFCLPFSDFKRSIIIVKKLGKTPEKYPRNIGIPRKRPL